MIKLIAIDVDGTLLNSKHELSLENKKSIQWAEENGITIALASGRPLNGLFD
ncbi:MAG: HAD family hydrolase, partial [Erysipelotrichaceae bacterium]